MTPPRHWQNAAIAVITLAAVLTLSGCNTMQSSKSNPTNTGTGTQATTHVGLSVSSLDFGNVVVGSNKTMHISLTNSTDAGGASVTVSQVKVSGTGFSVPNTSNLELAPGQSTDIAVSFKPTTSGNASGTLTIDIVGASDPASVPLAGDGTVTASNSQLSVSPAQLSFGNVNVGSSKNLTGTLKATGEDVKVSSAAWTGSGYSLSGITFPVTIKAGSTKSFTVTFAPQAAGSASGNVNFNSDATDDSASSQNFAGTGVQVAQQHVVNLVWSASSSAITGYNVYRGTQSGGPYSKVNAAKQAATTYNDSTVQSGRTYFYVATAVASDSTESNYSNEVVAVVPTP